MKTPDEIKRGIECCGGDCFCVNEECPYDKDDLKENISCIRWMAMDAPAYIQQLERERDALLDALKKADVYGECENCKHRDSAPSDCDFECGSCQRNCRCWECRDGDKWEWVGVKEDDK